MDANRRCDKLQVKFFRTLFAMLWFVLSRNFSEEYMIWYIKSFCSLIKVCFYENKNFAIFMSGHSKRCEMSRKVVQKKCPDECVRVRVLRFREIQTSVPQKILSRSN